jgi:hypothetical protein
MTTEERVQNLKSFGYTDREAGFLVQAALHSGYFLRRQYCAAIGRNRGKCDESFIARMRSEKHVAEMDLRYRRRVFSICSKVLFEALGEPDNRNRRRHDAQTIKARLMGFDYVLERPEVHWYPTESEKVTLFSEELGIEKEHLPVWRYASKDGKRATLRFFVDRPLIFRGQDGVIRFGFVDPGYRTAEAFASFLRNYRPLFSRLNRFELIYVAGFQAPVDAARGLFDRFVSPSGSAPEDPMSADLTAYFADRNEHLLSGLSAFDQPRLDRYREARKRFTGVRFDELFDRWKQQGDSAVRAIISPESRADLRARAAFGGHVLSFNFGLFGSLYEGRQG